MMLIFEDQGWPMFVSGWTAGWPPSGDTTNLQYVWDSDGTPKSSRVVIPAGEEDFRKYLVENAVEDVCDLRPLQKGT